MRVHKSISSGCACCCCVGTQSSVAVRSDSGGLVITDYLLPVLFSPKEQLRGPIPKGNCAIREVEGFPAIPSKPKVRQLESAAVVD
eukprot:scaffold111780_cov53-Prasinocladus_malaysianus.AAC.1